VFSVLTTFWLKRAFVGKMNRQLECLASYVDAPELSAVSVFKLARAHFEYQNGVFVCRLCGLSLLPNEVDNEAADPIQTHKLRNRSCQFESQTCVSGDLLKSIGNQTGFCYAPAAEPAPLTHAPLDYRLVADRELSFQGKLVGAGQTAWGLAEAGFYHVGSATGDNVKCFKCNGGLRNWQSTDVPMQEHKRYFPECPFVLSQTPSSSANSTSAKYRVEPREIRARMDTPMVMAVLSTGQPAERVYSAIQNRLTTTGDDFKSSGELLTSILEQ
jgi:hypothetical protein